LRSVINSPAAFNSFAAVTLCADCVACAAEIAWGAIYYPGQWTGRS
jgi:hypothetical protein